MKPLRTKCLLLHNYTIDKSTIGGREREREREREKTNKHIIPNPVAFVQSFSSLLIYLNTCVHKQRKYTSKKGTKNCLQSSSHLQTGIIWLQRRGVKHILVCSTVHQNHGAHLFESLLLWGPKETNPHCFNCNCGTCDSMRIDQRTCTSSYGHDLTSS